MGSVGIEPGSKKAETWFWLLACI